MEHPPLTQKQIDTLNEIPAEGREYSIAEMTDRGLDLGFLETCGYLTSIQTFANPDLSLNRYRYSRTVKAIA